MKSSYDVVIAGFGPVGGALARLLSRSPLDILVVDKAADVFDKPRAIGMDHEAMRVLQFCDVAHDLLPHVRTFRGSVWLGVDGQVIREFVPASGPQLLGWPPNFTFLQPQFERLLRERVEECRNVDVHQRTELVGLEQDRATVRVHLRRAGASPTTVHARYVIGCDGANSRVRRSQQIDLEDLGLDEWWVVIDARRTGVADFGDRNVQYCSPDRPGTYVVGPGDLRRWEFRILPHESPEDFKDEQRVLAVLRERVDTSQLEIWRSATYRFGAAVANSWRAGRIFLAGDAAHQTPPHLGQGLCSGLRDAANLAWKILHVEAGASDALLDTYMTERRPHFKSLAQTATNFGSQIGMLDPAAAVTRDAELQSILDARTEPEVRQSHVPRLSAGFLDLDEHGTPSGLAGTQFVQPRVHNATGDTVLLDDDREMRFQIVTTGGEPARWLDAEAAAQWRRISGDRLAILPAGESAESVTDSSVTTLVESGSVFADWVAVASCAAVVVRPDRYVYGTANTAAELNRLVVEVLRSLGSGVVRQRP